MTTPSLAELVARVERLIAQLRPAAFDAQLAQELRGGHRAQSFGDGRGGDPPLPMSDAHDRQIMEAVARYRAVAANVYAGLLVLRSIERAWLPPVDPRARAVWHARLARQAADEVSPSSVACANGWCGRVIENTAADRVLGGRCRACHEYRRDHGGRERPRELVEREIDRGT